MKDATTSSSDRIARRRYLKAAAGAATAAVSIPVVTSSAAAHFTQTLDVDIEPRRDENTIDPASYGTISVAVLATEFEDEDGNTVVFDPTERDVRYRFGAPDVVADGGGAPPIGDGHVVDVNGDGSDELVLHFPTRETGFDGDESDGELRWERDETGEHGLAGTDSVTVVGRNWCKQWWSFWW